MSISSANIAGWAAIIGWIFSAVIVAKTGNIPPMLLTSVASAIGFIACFAYWLAKKEPVWSKFKMPFKSYAFGTFGICGYTAFWLTGMKIAPAFEANALNYTWPLILIFITARLDKTSLSINELSGIAAGFLGSLLIFSRYGFSEYDPIAFIGLALSFLAAIIWAVYSGYSRFHSFNSDAIGVFLIITSIICYIMHLLFEAGLPIYLTTMQWGFVVLLGITRVSFIFWDYAMKNGDRRMFASLAYLIPAFSVLFLGLLEKTGLTIITISGVTIIITGCLMANIGRLKFNRIK